MSKGLAPGLNSTIAATVFTVLGFLHFGNIRFSHFRVLLLRFHFWLSAFSRFWGTSWRFFFWGLFCWPWCCSLGTFWLGFWCILLWSSCLFVLLWFLCSFAFRLFSSFTFSCLFLVWFFVLTLAGRSFCVFHTFSVLLGAFCFSSTFFFAFTVTFRIVFFLIRFWRSPLVFLGFSLLFLLLFLFQLLLLTRFFFGSRFVLFFWLLLFGFGPWLINRMISHGRCLSSFNLLGFSWLCCAWLWKMSLSITFSQSIVQIWDWQMSHILFEFFTCFNCYQLTFAWIISIVPTDLRPLDVF